MGERRPAIEQMTAQGQLRSLTLRGPLDGNSTAVRERIKVEIAHWTELAKSSGEK